MEPGRLGRDGAAAGAPAGKGSGGELQQTYWSVWTIRDGQAAKLALYVDRDRALEAIGR